MTKFKTPLISSLRTSGGTFYTMPSATEDIGLNINESTNKVAMSHYVLLNIPDTYKGHSEKNYFNFNTIANPTDLTNPSAALAESLENYVFNFETALRNQNGYDYSAAKTVSERAFWKWLQRTGALKLEKITDTKGLPGNYFKEIQDSSASYNSVIVGFGKVAASNYRSDESTIYNEVYVQIPSSYGMMNSWFKEYNDDNYKTLPTVDVSLQGHSEVLSGGFRNEAFRDGTGYIVDTSTNHENVEIEFSTTNIAKLLDKSTITYDELAIDSTLVKANKYEFNAIGLYYSIYDMNSNILATNLFGIMFLDSIYEFGDEFHFNIPRLQKKKSTDTTEVKGFGNGYSFRINLRTSAIYDDTTATIEDYSTAGSEITNDFNTVIANLNNAISIMKSNTVYNATLSDKYNALNVKVIELMNTLEDKYSDLENKYLALEQRVKALEDE